MTGELRKELSIELTAVARDLWRQKTSQDTLRRVVHHARRLVPRCREASFLLVRRRRSNTHIVTGDLARQADEVLISLREGPYFDLTGNSGRFCHVVDMAAVRDRWPRYRAGMLGLGVRSVMAFPLYNHDSHRKLGVLTLYSTEPDVFSEWPQEVAWLVATHASIAYSNARAVENLCRMVVSRQRTGQAIGIVMERLKVTEDTAAAILITASQHQNVRFATIASEVVETGKIPTHL